MTTLIAVMVALVPGGLLGFIVPPGRYRWAVWAAAPALSLGLTTVAMAWLPAIGLPHSAAAVLVAELVLAGGAILLSRLMARGLIGPAEGGPDEGGTDEGGPAAQARPSLAARLHLPPVRPRRADIIGMAVPAAMSVAFGWLMLGRLVAPPGWDAMNHGYLTRRILETGSTTISAACTTGVTETVSSCSFYPLAANVSWAQAAQLSGGQIGTVMTAWTILVGPLAMVAGVYACVRALGGHPVVAACAAAAPTFLGPMWPAMLTGRVTGQSAPCLAGGIALLIALALRGPHPVRLGLLAGVASAGMVMTHTYDVLFIAALAAGLLLCLRGPLTLWSLRSLRSSAVGVGATAVAGIGSLVPLFGVLIGANSERLSGQPGMPGDYSQAFWYWVVDLQRYVLFGYPAPGGRDFQLGVLTVQIGLVLTVACLLASPLCLSLPQLRWARPWFAAGVLFTVIGIWTTVSGSRPAMALAGLWYGVRERVRTMILPVYGLLAVAGAIAIGIGVKMLATKLADRWQVMRRLATSRLDPGPVAASILVLSLALLAAVPSSWRPLRLELARSAPVGHNYVEAFEWLSEHTPPGKVVAYDRHVEFMTWSYVNHGAALLFGIPPLQLGPNRDNYNQRWTAWDWLVNNEDAPPAGCLVRRFGIEYVVTGNRRIPRVTSIHYDRERLTDSDRITLVHEVGAIKIYQVNDLGRTCPEPT